MSYNIDTFKLKEIVDLKIPVSALYLSRKDWHPTRHEDVDVTTFRVAEDVEIEGTVSGEPPDEILSVSRFSCRGECSGNAMIDVFEPAFAKSTGTLTASCVWEGGDCINRLEVRDGVVTWVPIEI